MKRGLQKELQQQFYFEFRDEWQWSGTKEKFVEEYKQEFQDYIFDVWIDKQRNNSNIIINKWRDYEEN